MSGGFPGSGGVTYQVDLKKGDVCTTGRYLRNELAERNQTNEKDDENLSNGHSKSLCPKSLILTVLSE